MIFDYRLRHRGCANGSALPRPVAYLVYAQPGAVDTHNFPTGLPKLLDERSPAPGVERGGHAAHRRLIQELRRVSS